MISPFRAIVSLILLAALLMPPNVQSGHQEKKLAVRTTAYTHSESDHIKYGRKTAIGTTLRNTRSYTSAAADWSRFPVGTTFRIEGMKTTFVIDDYGSALVGTSTIDLYHPSKSSMNRWGVRHVNIDIIKFGDYERSRRILAKRTKYSHCRKMLAAIPKNSGQPERRWWWSRKPKADAPAPDPKPVPAPAPARKPEPSAPVMLAANTKSPPPPARPAPRPPQPPRPQAQSKPKAPPAPTPKTTPAPTPAPTPPAPVAQPNHHEVQLASAKPAPQQISTPTPAPAPPSPAAPVTPEIAKPTTLASASTPPSTRPPSPATSVPIPHKPRAVVPISRPTSAGTSPAATSPDEPIALERPAGSEELLLASADSVAVTPQPMFAVARPNSPVPHRKREVRSLPAGFRPAAMN